MKKNKEYIIILNNQFIKYKEQLSKIFSKNLYNDFLLEDYNFLKNYINEIIDNLPEDQKNFMLSRELTYISNNRIKKLKSEDLVDLYDHSKAINNLINRYDLDITVNKSFISELIFKHIFIMMQNLEK